MSWPSARVGPSDGTSDLLADDKDDVDDEKHLTDHTHNQNLVVKDENGVIIGHMCSLCGLST